MSPQGTEWWGGSLSDGSLVVLSPSGSALLLADSSSPSGLPPGAGKEKASSLREWVGIRSRVPFPYEQGGHSIGIRRGTLALAVVVLLVSMIVVNWMVEGVLGLSATSVPGGLATLGAGTVVCILLLALIYAIEVLPMKRRGVQFISIAEDDDDYLRYVHSAVSSTPEWKTLECVARENPPPSEKASDIHSLLWDAAGIKPTLDAAEILPHDRARMDEMALLARGL